MNTQQVKLKEFTTEDVIKIIYWNKEDDCKKLLQEFEMAQSAEKYDKAVILWDSYNRFRQAYAATIFEELLQKARDGKITETTGLMNVARIQAHHDFEKMLTGEQKDVNEIESIRQRLQTLSAAVAN